MKHMPDELIDAGADAKTIKALGTSMSGTKFKEVTDPKSNLTKEQRNDIKRKLCLPNIKRIRMLIDNDPTISQAVLNP